MGPRQEHEAEGLHDVTMEGGGWAVKKALITSAEKERKTVTLPRETVGVWSTPNPGLTASHSRSTFQSLEQ